eukprot:jgi/Tetstr1/423501/TSEL_014178.t1
MQLSERMAVSGFGTQMCPNAYVLFAAHVLHSLRLVRDPGVTDANKGFAFAVYHTKETAADAIQQLGGKVLASHPGSKPVRVVISEVKNRLFLGNLRKDMTKEDLQAMISGVARGLEDVEVLPTKVAGDHNRGWCFASFYNHHTADAARKALSPPGFQLHGRPLTVKWAEPKARDEPFASSEPVRALYVTKLPPGANNENLSEIFSPYGTVERIAIPPPKQSAHAEFGFVYYQQRQSALDAAAAMEADPPALLGNRLVVQMAKAQMAPKRPGDYDSAGRGGYGGRGRGPPGGRGYLGGRGPSYPSAAPMMMDPSRMDMGGMTMVPMMLPNGQVGYVLQEGGPGTLGSLGAPPAPGFAPGYAPAPEQYYAPPGGSSHGPMRGPGYAPAGPGHHPYAGRGGDRFGGGPYGGGRGQVPRYNPY